VEAPVADTSLADGIFLEVGTGKKIPPGRVLFGIHPNLLDFYVGFCWFTGQIVH
jgi:hypothetical protein